MKDSKYLRAVGERIRFRRIEMGLTQDELAQRVGYKSRASINKIELGKTDMTQSLLNKFSAALYVPTAYILDGSEPAPLLPPVKPEPEIAVLYNKLSETQQAEVMSYIRFLLHKK